MNEHIENIGPVVQLNKKKKMTLKGWGMLYIQLHAYN